ncbi:hypothetical protein Q3G72_020487 [Acer saccharum]|nr:hypothetical protein Q3G72_020487 [Acer saccharum]
MVIRLLYIHHQKEICIQVQHHHPKNQISKSLPGTLSDKGLPLRPGAKLKWKSWNKFNGFEDHSHVGDIRGYLASLSILQDCYLERLGKLSIVHSPYIFMTAWKFIYPFIDSITKKKIVFVEKKKLKSTLLEDIDESQLPDIYMEANCH